MKILSVAGSPPDNSAKWHRITNIERILRSNGHEVDRVCYIRSGLRKELNNSKTVSFMTVHLKHLWFIWKADYDLMYGHTDIGTFYSVLGKLKRIPLFFDMHGETYEEFLMEYQFSPLYLLRLFLTKWANIINLKFSDRILCVSKKMIQYLHEERDVSLEKLVYLPNGVDLEFFRHVNSGRMKASIGIQQRKFVFGYVGNFQRWQGLESLIEAAKRIDNPDIEFLVIGGEKRKTENGICFIPKVPYSQIPAWYSICDVLVLPRPSHIVTEVAAPTKFAEYTAMGKPVLITDVGDAADLVRKYGCGLVVKDNSPDHLIKGIMDFKALPECKIHKMGNASRKLAENEFDWKILSKNLEKVLVPIA